METGTDKIYPERTKVYSSDELAELINRYSRYADIAEREILIEYVDYALDMLERNGSNQESLRMLTELADLRQRKIIKVPDWINGLKT